MSPALDARKLLSELVSIPSVSGSESDLADFVIELCRERSVECERVGDSVIARIGNAAGPRLLLNSHLDTVPVGEGWHADPFDGTWRDGRLTARGANDAKSSAAAMLWSLLELARTNATLEGELVLALTACEETNNSGMTAVIEHLGLPDAAVTGEPTGLEVVRVQAGLAVLTAEWSGVSCHAAHVARVEHENALHEAALELAALGPWVELPGEHELIGKSTLATTVFHAGSRHNVVPDKAEAVFDARLAPPHDAAECVAILQQYLHGATIGVRSERLRPVETAADHPLVRTALQVTGKPQAIGSNTLSDMALLVGVPSIKCGPGETSRSHTANEYVTEGELDEACRFYATLAPEVLGALAEVRVP